MIQSFSLFLPKNVLEKKYGKVSKGSTKAKYNISHGKQSFILPSNSDELIRSAWGLLPYHSTSQEEDRIYSLALDELDRLDEIKFQNKRKCIIPASGFYLWNNDSNVSYMTLKTQSHFAFAGICDSWQIGNDKYVNSFAILLRDNPAGNSELDKYLPAILSNMEAKAWLESDELEINYLNQNGNDDFHISRVSDDVKNPENDSIDLIRSNNSSISGANYKLF